MPERPTDHARQNRRNATKAERILWARLRRRAWSFKWRRQHPVGPFIADFACVEAHLIVEINGWSHDKRKEGYDLTREAWLRSEGWDVHVICDEDVLQREAETLETIRLLCEARTK